VGLPYTTTITLLLIAFWQALWSLNQFCVLTNLLAEACLLIETSNFED